MKKTKNEIREIIVSYVNKLNWVHDELTEDPKDIDGNVLYKQTNSIVLRGQAIAEEIVLNRGKESKNWKIFPGNYYEFSKTLCYEFELNMKGIDKRKIRISDIGGLISFNEDGTFEKILLEVGTY